MVQCWMVGCVRWIVTHAYIVTSAGRLAMEIVTEHTATKVVWYCLCRCEFSVFHLLSCTLLFAVMYEVMHTHCTCITDSTILQKWGPEKQNSARLTRSNRMVQKGSGLSAFKHSPSSCPSPCHLSMGYSSFQRSTHRTLEQDFSQSEPDEVIPISRAISAWNVLDCGRGSQVLNGDDCEPFSWSLVQWRSGNLWVDLRRY